MDCNKISSVMMKNQIGIFKEKCHNIIYCKAYGKSTSIYIKGNKDPKQLTKCLKHIEQNLNLYCFIRIHHNCIVNVNFIDAYNKLQNKIVLTDGTELDVSTRKKNNLKKVLKEKYALI